MLKPSKSPPAIGIAVLLGVLGCSRDPLAGRKALDPEAALHGHWSSTRDVELAPDAGRWDTANSTERPHVELDRFIDARTEPKAWIEVEGERGWQTESMDPTTGAITVKTWPAGRSAKQSVLELRFDAERSTLLERLPSGDDKSRLRLWNYINNQARP